jgi:NADH dehydrogenase FAD-containing subunit
LTTATIPLLLLGAGHAHTVALRHWAQQRPAALKGAVLVSPSPRVPYSGMVPGWLAGHYRWDQICIDIRPLCAAAGVRWLAGELLSLDAATRRVRLDDGRELQAQWLSINTGSTLEAPAWPGVRVLALRPLSALRAAWEAVLAGPPPAALLTAGGGAAGVEATLAVLARLRQEHPGLKLPAQLVTRTHTLLPGMPPAAQRAAHDALSAAGVAVLTNTDATPAMAAAPGSLLLWATGATAPTWPAAGGLATDSAGFIRIDTTLRSTSHPQVLASGDIASLQAPLPKAGVHAVRMGPLLAHNLQALLTGQAPKPYTRGAQALALLATADGRAIAARGPFSLAGPRLGRVLWRWKDRIDRRFVAGGR